MEITYGETWEDRDEATEWAELSLPGEVGSAGMTEVLAEAAWGRLRHEFGLTGEIESERDRDRTRLRWRLGKDRGNVMPAAVYEPMVASDFEADDLSAAREAAPRKLPVLAAPLPGDPAALAAAVELAQEAVASGPPVRNASGASCARSTEGSVWTQGDAPFGREHSMVSRAANWFRRLAREAGEEAVRRVCLGKDWAMAAATPPASAVEQIQTRCEFRPLGRDAVSRMDRKGDFSGTSGPQRQLALGLVERRVSGFMVAALRTAAGAARVALPT